MGICVPIKIKYEDKFGDSFSFKKKSFNKIVFDFISTMYLAMILCGKENLPNQFCCNYVGEKIQIHQKVNR